MPIYKEFVEDGANVSVWKYDLADNLDAGTLLEPENLERFSAYSEKKLLEALMVRQMLQLKLPGCKILYTAENEPYLEPKNFEISISHSYPYAALAVSKQKTGIDLEQFRDKIVRVKDKFIEPEEQGFIPEVQRVEYLTVIWSIKESLYKIHHSNYWSLKKYYEVYPFHLKDKQVRCRVHDENFSDAYAARVHYFEDYVLTVVV